jgi:hypothetical protein
MARRSTSATGRSPRSVRRSTTHRPLEASSTRRPASTGQRTAMRHPSLRRRRSSTNSTPILGRRLHDVPDLEQPVVRDADLVVGGRLTVPGPAASATFRGGLRSDRARSPPATVPPSEPASRSRRDDSPTTRGLFDATTGVLRSGRPRAAIERLGVSTIATCHSPTIGASQVDRAFELLRAVPTADVLPQPDQLALDEVVATLEQAAPRSINPSHSPGGPTS